MIIQSNQVVEFFSKLFGTESWPARWVCGQWTEFHGWMYIISDVLIWGAYFTIPGIILYFTYKKNYLPFNRIFLLFSAFIFACGLTHLIDAIIFYYPIYRFSAFTRLFTAGVSWITVFALIGIIPKALSYKSPDEFESEVGKRMLAEEKNKMLNNITEALPPMAFTADKNGNIKYFNKRWFDYTGLTEQESIENWDCILHPDEREKVVNQWNNAINNRISYHNETRLKDKNGIYRWFIVNAIPTLNKNNEVEMWVGTCTDIHEKKLMEDKKDEFIGIASHELRTPLTAIKAYSQLLNISIKDESKFINTQEYIDKIISHSNDLQTLINDLLDVSKIQSGNIKLNISSFSFDELITEIVEASQLMYPTHTIVAQGNTGILINADKQRIGEVVANFISNAVKYSPDADKIQVNLKLTDRNTILCEIVDFGVGIPEEEISNIFNRFYRAKSAADINGMGLGLYIASEIVKMHGGKIGVNSRLNSGSTFYFTLPVEPQNF